MRTLFTRHSSNVVTCLLATVGVMVAIQRAWALPNCNPPIVYGCEDGPGICSFLMWNYRDSALAGWQCNGSTPVNYACIQQMEDGCCTNIGAAQCTSAQCPCPY